MFASSSAFGQSSANPYGYHTAFGQTNNPSSNSFTPNPFGSPNPFGPQTGSSIFGSTSTGVFGASQSSTPAFGMSSIPAFGASTTPTFGSPSPSFGGSSVFGQKPAFGGFGFPTSLSSFGSNFQQSKPSNHSNLFGFSPPFGVSGQPLFGASMTSPSFGSSSSPAFGSSSTPAFGSTTPAFGANTTPTFGVSNTPAFGSSNTTNFGNTGIGSGVSANPFGFGVPNTPTFGSSSTPAFGATSSPSFGLVSTPAFGSIPSTPSFGSSTNGQTTPFGTSLSGSNSIPFGQQSAAFGSHITTTTFGSSGCGQSPFEAQRGGSRITPYTPTYEADIASGQTRVKLETISAMPAYKDKSIEELRWEDYQLSDRGGPNSAAQPASALGFGISSAQSNPFASSSTFGQSSSSPFSSPSSNLFGAKSSPFGSTGFGTSTSGFCSSGFGTANASNPFGASAAVRPAIFSAPSITFGSNTSIFGTTSALALGSSPSLFGPASVQGTTSSFTSGLNFLSQPFKSSTSIGQTSGAFGQTSLSFGLTSTASFGQSKLFSTPLSFGGGNLFPRSSSPFSTSGFGQTPSLSTPFPAAQSTPASSLFSFGNFNHAQTGLDAFGSGSSIFGQSAGQLFATQSSAVVQNPFGVLPATPQISIGHAGTSSIQYGISCIPVVDKPTPARISPLLTSRHLSQSRIKLPARKYHPKSDGQKVAFFSDEEIIPSSQKAEGVFIPRENPRALIARPMDQWPSKASMEKSSPLKDITSSLHENGRTPTEESENVSNSSEAANKGKSIDDDQLEKEQNHLKSKGSQRQQWNGIHDDHQSQKTNSYISLGGHRAGEAAIVYEHGAEIEAMMPKLRHSDYYTEPRIHEVAAKERAERGSCRRVKNFVVGRHGYGSIKFLGETDVRRLDLESLIQFNNREVIVYMDESKKPPIGQGLNKAAEVSLLNIKCYNKKTREYLSEGPKVEKYREMLRKKAENQGAEFMSYDPVKGEWKFKVNHFSSYKLDQGR